MVSANLIFPIKTHQFHTFFPSHNLKLPAILSLTATLVKTPWNRHENCWKHGQHASGTKKIKLKNQRDMSYLKLFNNFVSYLPISSRVHCFKTLWIIKTAEQLNVVRCVCKLWDHLYFLGYNFYLYSSCSSYFKMSDRSNYPTPHPNTYIIKV